MKLNVIIEDCPEGFGAYLGLAIERISKCTNLHDAALLLNQSHTVCAYEGGSHVAIHRKQNGNLVPVRLAILTEPL